MLAFLGFNLTFMPQFVLGYLGAPRRYHTYPAELQTLHALSSAGTLVLAAAYVLPLGYLLWSLRHGAPAGADPWRATGLEWRTASPPPKGNFDFEPEVAEPPYAYSGEARR